MKSFYVVDSTPNGGKIPYFFETIWTPELPIFDLPMQNPSAKDFANKYEVRAKIESLEVDVLINDFLATSEFLKVCDSLKTSYLSAPALVTLDDSKRTTKEYSFFCVTARGSVLDQKKSDYELIDKRLLRSAHERRNLPVYDRIEKFVLKDSIEEDLLYCEEIKRVICSSDFKLEFDRKNLMGLNFVAIDEDYVYAPWDGF